MDLTEIKYVIAIAEYRNISKAADSLFITQPRLSRILSKLESELGVPLFDRSSFPLKLTYAGERFLDYAKKLVAMENSMKAELFHISSSGIPRLYVGVPPRRGAYILPLILPEFSRMHPETEVIICEGTSDKQRDMLIREESDVSIFSLPNMPEDILCEELIRDPLFLMLPPSHPLYYSTSDSAVPFLDEKLYPMLEGNKFISIDTPSSITKRLIRYLSDNGVNCSISIRTQNNLMTYRLCEQGLGNAAIMGVAANNTLFIKKPCLFRIGNPPLEETWYIATKKGKKRFETTQDFINIAHKAAHKLLSSFC